MRDLLWQRMTRQHQETDDETKHTSVQKSPPNSKLTHCVKVDAEGRSWRSGAVVEKRPLTQWFLKTTNFSQSLLEGLEDPSLEDWRDVIKLQQHWIGRLFFSADFFLSTSSCQCFDCCDRLFCITKVY